MYKINLACGTDVRDGWINFDIVEKWPTSPRACDVHWDGRKDNIPLPNGSVEEVYAGYLLLHLAPIYHDRVLREIYRVMTHDALLRVSEVDMEIVLKRWLKNPHDVRTCELIWGEQGRTGDNRYDNLVDFDKHCHGFSEETLRILLKRNGFEEMSRISVHHVDVYYELTLDCRKKSI